MNVNDVATLISTLGFPIVAVIAIAVAMWKIIQYNNATTEKREEKLYTMIGECQNTNETLLETNAKFAHVLEVHTSELETIKSDVAVIKNYLEEKEV